MKIFLRKNILFRFIVISILCLFTLNNVSYGILPIDSRFRGNDCNAPSTLAPTQLELGLPKILPAISQYIAEILDGCNAAIDTEGLDGLRAYLERKFPAEALALCPVTGLKKIGNVFYFPYTTTTGEELTFCYYLPDKVSVEPPGITLLSNFTRGRVICKLIKGKIPEPRAPERRELPDGSPYRIYNYLLEETKGTNRWVTLETIQAKTTGRTEEGTLSLEVVERDLRTLRQLNLAKRKYDEKRRTNVYSAIELSRGEWMFVKPILESLGIRPTKEEVTSAKEKINELLSAFNELHKVNRSLWGEYTGLLMTLAEFKDEYLRNLRENLESSDKRKGPWAKRLDEAKAIRKRIHELHQRRPSIERREALKDLEARLKAIVQKKGFAVLNLIGRLGVGKTTISNIITLGIDDIPPSGIMNIHVDQFRNDIVLINKLIDSREILNRPLEELSDTEFTLLTDAARTLRMYWPREKRGRHSFLNYYKLYRKREESRNTTYVVNERAIRTAPNAYRSMEALSQTEFNAIKKLAASYGIAEDTLTANIKQSLWMVYQTIEHNKFLAAVKKTEPIYEPVQLFIVEGTYSYQGQDIFDADAQRLKSDVSVAIVVDEATRRERVKRRGNSSVQEELLELDLLDMIYTTTIDIECELADIKLDNTKETNEYQIAKFTWWGVVQAAGDALKKAGTGIKKTLKVQFGIPTETAKDMMSHEFLGGGVVPDVFVLPPELFHGGRNYADIEFVLYYKYYLQKGKRVTLVGTPLQLENLRIFLQESLFGPDPNSVEFKSYDKDTQLIIKTAREKYTKINRLEEYINFIPFKDGRAEVEKDGGKFVISALGANKFSVYRVGDEAKIKEVEIDYRAPKAVVPKISEKHREALLDAVNQHFAVTPLGTSHGFDIKGDYTNLIIWLEGQGIFVDPSPKALDAIDSLGMDEDVMPYVFLTHTHADHDGGLLRRILTGRRIKLITSRPILDSFIKKAQVLVGPQFNVREWIDFIEVKPGEALELELPNGQKAVIESRYNLHPIPTLGFKVSYGNYRFGYSGDTEYNPEMIEGLFKEGKLTRKQADDLLYFLWDKSGQPTVDLIFHEAGVPPIHTQASLLAQLLPNTIKEILHLVHIADTDNLAGLRKAIDYNTYVLWPSDEESRLRMIVNRMQIASMAISKLPEEARKGIEEKGQKISFKSGDTIIRQGEAVNEESMCYMLISGKVRVEKDGKEIWRYERSGELFGEMAFIENIPRTASCFAEGDVEVLALTRAQFDDIIKNPHPMLTQEMKRLIRNLDLLQQWNLNLAGDDMPLLNMNALKHLSSKSMDRGYKKGDTIINQGEEGNEFFIIKSGSVDVEIDGIHKKTLGKGDNFGEIALILDTPRTATVKAREDTELLVVNKKDFNEILLKYPGLKYALTRQALERKGIKATVGIKEAEREAQDFINRLITWALDHPDEKLVIGLGTTWLSDTTQYQEMQGLLGKLDDISKQYKNIIICRQNGAKLAEEVSQKAENVPASNVIILEDQGALDLKNPASPFAALKQKGVFFAEINMPADFPKDSYIGLLNMLTLATKLAFNEEGVSLDAPFVKAEPGESRRIFIFIPKAVPIDVSTNLRDIYEKELSIIHAA